MSAPPADKLHPVAFWFLRHGETDWNARGWSQGNVDIPLNETGLAQARSAALLLRGKGIRSVISSPLSRAKVTAELRCGRTGTAGAIRRRSTRGRLRRAGRQADVGVVPALGGRRADAGRARKPSPPSPPARWRRSTAASCARRRSWSWRTALCSGRYAAQWGTSRTFAPGTPCRSGASLPLQACQGMGNHLRRLTRSAPKATPA